MFMAMSMVIEVNDGEVAVALCYVVDLCGCWSSSCQIGSCHGGEAGNGSDKRENGELHCVCSSWVLSSCSWYVLGNECFFGMVLGVISRFV